ncbi:MAG: NAD(P)H-hydrate epimerase [Candidatus Omnitrophica bacterium]|nr:NAD(P)H-hydrate epimerase [Candidatus Omnitrophota bacterium]
MTVSQIRKIETRAIQTIGIPSLVLMDNAGRAVAESVVKYLKKQKHPKVVIVCGCGNNGGDGMVAARYITLAQIKTDVFLIGTPDDLKPDPKVFCKTLAPLGVRVKAVKKIDAVFIRSLAAADVVIDALFGIGLNRPVTGLYREAIEAMNSQARRIWAADISSGLDGTSGDIWGVAVKAFRTVSFSFLKTGFFKKDGPRHTGRIEVVDIGIPLSSVR